MTEHEQANRRTLRTTDPATMRALAHPLRVEILALLDDQREMTASEIADRLDQTVANCSFHLRTLEKHGYVERAPQRGREKPWRPVHDDRNLLPDPADPASVAQASELATIYVQREAARLTQTFDRMAGETLDPEWVRAMTVTNTTFWATAEEMAELARTLENIADRFAGRGEDPSKRPPGARKGHLFAAVNADPDSEPTP